MKMCLILYSTSFVREMNSFTILKIHLTVVCGAGHVGCEAALAASRLGSKVLMITEFGYSCPNELQSRKWRTRKGQIVREIDALGGEMALNTDYMLFNSNY